MEYPNTVSSFVTQTHRDVNFMRSRACIHKFSAASLRNNVDKNTPCAITSLVQSPAIDVVAIGFSNGEISIYDIRADERLMRIFMEGGTIRGLSFRSGKPSCFALSISLN